MSEHARRWTDESYLRDVQYRDASNLAARQAIYAYQQPRLNVWSWALALAELEGDEAIADIGCGNGRYLRQLKVDGHRGLTIGVDFSAGMLAGITAERPDQAVVQADAARLPLADGSVDVAMAMHMLYHLPSPEQAVAELRRVVRPGGVALVLLNTDDTLADLRQLIRDAAERLEIPLASSMTERLDVERGAELVAEAFTLIERHDARAQLVVPEPEPVLAYVASMASSQQGSPRRDAFLELVWAGVAEEIGREGAFCTRTAVGCLVCR